MKLLPLALLSLLLPASAQALSVKILDLPANDVVYNPADGLLYASVRSYVSERGNTVTLIEPNAGSIVASIPVGSEPNALALSQDGSKLYVGLMGAGMVKRIDTGARSVDLAIPLPVGTLGPVFAEDISVQPGHPNTFAVSLRYEGLSPRHAGVAVFDDSTMRPVKTQEHTGANIITFGDRPERLYGNNTETTEYGFRRFDVTGSGLTQISVVPDLIGGWWDMEWFANRIYSNGGRVIDPEAGTLLGQFGFSVEESNRVVAPDTSVTYWVVRGSQQLFMRRYDTEKFSYIDQRLLVSPPGNPQVASTLVRWGVHGLAFPTYDVFSDDPDTKVYILDGIDDPPSADLTVSATVSQNPAVVNSYVDYNVVLRNAGPDDAEGVQMSSAFTNYQPVFVQPTGGFCPGGAPCQFGTVPAGDSVSVRYSFYPTTPGNLNFHSVAATFTPDPNPGNNETDGVIQIVPQPELPNLRVEVAVDHASIAVGQPLRVRVAVSNRGIVAAQNARLEYQLNGSGLHLNGIDNPRGTCSEGDSSGFDVCNLGNLVPGDSVTVTYSLTAQSYGFVGGFFQAGSATQDADPFDNVGSFYISVQPSAEALVDSLYERVRQLSLKNGATRSLLRPLDDASTAFAAGDNPGGCAALRDFENTLNQRVGRALSIPAAYSLLAQSMVIRDFVGCDAPSGRHFEPATRTHVVPATPTSFRVENNPTGGQARVSFSLAQAGHARVRVFDVRGRLVTTLGDRMYEAGSHQLAWQTPPTAGVYFYRFEPEGSPAITARGVIVP